MVRSVGKARKAIQPPGNEYRNQKGFLRYFESVLIGRFRKTNRFVHFSKMSVSLGRSSKTDRSSKTGRSSKTSRLNYSLIRFFYLHSYDSLQKVELYQVIF